MRTFALASGLGAALVLCQCGGGDFSSSGTGGTSNGSGGAATGGSNATGGAASTGGSNATGGTASTGGSSAGTGGAPPTWCATHDGLYCEDFDGFESADAFLASSSSYSSVKGLFSLDKDSTQSAPNALRVQSTETNVDSIVINTLPPFTAPPSIIRMEFSLRINQASNIAADSGVIFAALIPGASLTDGIVALELTSTGLYALFYKPDSDAGSGGLGVTQLSGVPSVGQWAGRFAIQLEYGLAADGGRLGCAQIYIGSLKAGSCMDLPATALNPTQVTVGLGLRSIATWPWLTPNTGQIDIEYDNVIVTTQ